MGLVLVIERGLQMSRKHYRALAEVLKSSNASLELCESIAVFLKKDNPRFLREKFLTACGVL